jgi:glyoxylase-like metal-dependent hydrolase (beta-lactamase superfamily II)
MYDDPLSLYESTLRRLQELAPARVYPGHLGVVTDTIGRAKEILAHHDRRLDETESHLKGGASSAAEIVVLLWGHGLTPHEQRFARGEAIAHLQRLRALGRVMQEGEDEWRAVA